MILVTIGLAVVSMPWLITSTYLLVLTLSSRRTACPSYGTPSHTFAIVVPAHNEAGGIARTVANLKGLDWPSELLRIIVVADNCVDDTAQKATDAGAEVLVRTDTERRGKGYALAHGFERSLALGCDAVVVIDADTVASPNLLHAFASRIDAGAVAVQADYAVDNVDASWRTRLMAIALGMFHILRSLGRERRGLSCGLRGNGMCFTRGCLAAVPHDAYSVVEDVEYGIRLGVTGYRVHYAEEAHVYGEMVTGEKASRSQRLRWERGRAALVRSYALELLRKAIRTRDKVQLDLFLDLVVPPLSTLCLWTVAGFTASALIAAYARSRGAMLPVGLWALSGTFVVAYASRGWWLSGTGGKGLLALLHAPAYVLWKQTLRFRRRPRARR